MTDPKLEALLRRHEGVRLKPYRDTVGKLTIGVGRNLDDVGVTPDEVTVLLRTDIDRTASGLDAALPWWSSLEPARRRVLMDMAFNLGVPGLLAFKLTLAAVRDGCFAEAAERMLQSRWATQVGERAREMAQAMRTGVDPKAPKS